MRARNSQQRLGSRTPPTSLRVRPLLLVGCLVIASASGTACIGVSQKRNAGAGVVGGDVADLNVCRAGIRVADDGAIDDFEDGNNQINLEGGRDGYW